MQTNDLILGGYTLDQLKEMKKAVSKDATKFIADHMEIATKHFAELRELLEEVEDDSHVTPEMLKLAEKANEAFKAVQLVSGITGVTFYLDFYEDWGTDGDVLSTALEDCPISAEELSELQSTLEEMEWQSRDWHSSRC